MKEEIKSLEALAKMRKTTEMNRLQQEAQRLRAKEIQINNLLQPYQEQITELFDAVEQKVRDFTTSRNEIDATEDSSISQAMLESAQECVETMEKEVAGLRQKLMKTLQEAKEKVQQEKRVVSGSRMSHK